MSNPFLGNQDATVLKFVPLNDQPSQTLAEIRLVTSGKVDIDKMKFMLKSQLDKNQIGSFKAEIPEDNWWSILPGK